MWINILFFSAFTAFTALIGASTALAVPTPAVVERAAIEDRGLFDQLLGLGTVSQLQAITSTLKSSVAPTLTQIQTSTSGSGLTNILSNAGLSSSASSTSTASVSTAGLITLLNDLSTLIPADQFNAIKTAIQNLPANISNDLYTLIAKVISVVKQIAAAQKSSASLVSSGSNGLLASLLGGTSVLTNLQSVITQVVNSLDTINSGVTASTSVAGVDAVAQVFASLKTPTDASLAAIVANSAKIISGFMALLKPLISNLTGLLNQLGLGSLTSTLKF
ncbi:hypothetical protein [Phaffia rhodozyma]|uniref:Uncharacterized protein n=1 Tax=Phaffia rhodozyma TaxID=264483 RepID=A0A0F7SI69_PHARH|nr:hypothetical protein [Phaffia rhodozyma]